MKIKLIDYSQGKLRAPERSHYNDAGADVYLPQKTVLLKGKTHKVRLGFGVAIPDGYFGLVYPRSSWAADGILMSLPPIDSGYRGEIHAVMTNMSEEPRIIQEGEKIGQLVVQPVVLADYVTDLGDERGTGAFGSTGK